MPSNTKENGFETLIVDTLVNSNGYEQGITTEYNKQYAIDEDRLFRFLMSTQKKAMDELHILDSDLEKDRFFKQLDKKLKSDGVIELLRKGLRYKHLRLDLFYVRPSVHNPEAAALYEKNIFSVTRQLQYSSFNPRLALDVCAFINGLPVITMELKNQLTKQNVFDAVEQYKNDRTPDEVLFSFKRCIVHFAVDDNEIRMCTELKGKKSWFLPFNKGFNNGAGNPPNPNGIKTDYLWKEILTKDELSNIIENYAQVIAEKDEDTGVTKYKQVFPRYHQLSVVKSLLSDAKRDGVGGRYLIQHSAGSGKSNSIAWLAHQLVTLKNDSGKEIFDTVIVVTDRINLDKQIKDTIKQFMQVSATVGWAKSAGELKQLLNEGKKIIITILEKMEYLGHMVNFKTRKQSYRSKKKLENPQDQWKIFENTHEAIIDEETFARVQELRKNKRRPARTGKTNMFSGLVRCADCGEKLYYCTSNSFETRQDHFVCSTSRKKGKEVCDTHFIRAVVLEEGTLQHMRLVIQCVADYEDAFRRALGAKRSEEAKKDLSAKKRTLQKSENRLAELDRLFKRIYEDMVNGKLSETRFQMLADDYEQEQADLRAKIEMLENEIQNQEDQAENVDRFIRQAKKYLYLEKLTPTILNDMVNAVYVHAPDKSSGHRVQDVTISYNYIGILLSLIHISEPTRP